MNQREIIPVKTDKNEIFKSFLQHTITNNTQLKHSIYTHIYTYTGITPVVICYTCNITRLHDIMPLKKTMSNESLSPLNQESIADLDRLCSIVGTESLSATQFLGILRGCGIYEDGQPLFDSLISMCRDAEAIAGSDANTVISTKSKVCQSFRRMTQLLFASFTKEKCICSFSFPSSTGISGLAR